MERGSDKHSPRVDEALEAEVRGMMTAGRETRGEEWNSAEPSGEDQPDVDLNPAGSLHGGVPDGMTEDDVETRSQIAGYLGKEVWPATAHQLMLVAQNRNAPDDVVRRLQQLPQGHTFGNMQEVWTALTGERGEHRF